VLISRYNVNWTEFLFIKEKGYTIFDHYLKKKVKMSLFML